MCMYTCSAIILELARNCLAALAGESLCINSGQLVVDSRNQVSVHVRVSFLYYPSKLFDSYREAMHYVPAD
jgi:hypothetical protein